MIEGAVASPPPIECLIIAGRAKENWKQRLPVRTKPAKKKPSGPWGWGNSFCFDQSLTGKGLTKIQWTPAKERNPSSIGWTRCGETLVQKKVGKVMKGRRRG